MAEKRIVVQDALVKCNQSVAPQTDKLKVLSQTKTFANDKSGSKKLVATTMEIGQTLEKNTFGNCKMQPNGTSYNPCIVQILKWSNFYKEVTYEENNGNPLLEDSKATCPIGGPDCIEIVNHGQKAEPNQQNAQNADKDAQNQLNPQTNLDEMNEEAKNEGLQAEIV